MDKSIMLSHIRKVNKTMIGLSLVFIFCNVFFAILLKVTAGFVGGAIEAALLVFQFIALKTGKFDRLTGCVSAGD